MKPTKLNEIATIAFAILLVASVTAPAAIVGAQSNDVTWSGEVEVDGTPATSGSQYQYDVAELDAVSNFSIDLTGSTAAAPASASGAVTSGGSSSFDVDGTTAPSNESIDVTASGTAIEPTEGTQKFDDDSFAGESGSGLYTSFAKYENPAESLGSAQYHLNTSHNGYSGASFNVDIYITDGWTGDSVSRGDELDWTKVKSDHTIEYGSTGWQSVDFDQNYSTTADNVTVAFRTTSVSGEGKITATMLEDQDGQADYYMDVASFNYYTTNTPLAMRLSRGQPAEDASVTVDGSTSSLGTLQYGESASLSPDLSKGSNSIEFSASNGGEVEWSADWTEHSETTDPTVEVNGHTVSHTGTLSDGETVSLKPDSAWIREGTNRVNVSMPATSGPTPQVGLDYDHVAADDVSVAYQGQTWTERYNVSRTYSNDRSDARLAVPFASNNVITVKSAEIQRNGNGWSEITDYSFDDGTLVAPIGEVQADESVSIRTTGRKVKTPNASITVVEPTMEGQDLESKVQLDSWGDNAAIDVAPSSRPDNIYYTHSESWSNADERTHVNRDTQQLQLPNASSGDTFYVKTAPMKAVPQGNGDVVVSIPDEGDLSTIETSPGRGSGDTIKYTYEAAESGTEYLLYSETNGVVVDSGTANSPVTLTGSDDHGRLTFQQEDTNTTSSGDGGGGGGLLTGATSGTSEAVQFNADNIPLSGILTPILLLGGVVGLFVFRGRLFGGSSTPSSTGGGSGGSGGALRGAGGRIKSGVGSVVSAGKRSVPFFGRVVKAVGVFIATIGRPLAKVAYKPLKPLIGRITPNTGGSSGSGGTSGGMLRRLLGNPRVVLFGGLAGAAVMLRYGIVAFSAEIEVLMVVVGTIIGSFVLLRWLSAFSWPLFGIVVGVVALLGAELVRPGSLLPRIGAGIEQIIPVLGLVAAYIAISWWRNRDKGGGGGSGGSGDSRVRDRIPGRRR